MRFVEKNLTEQISALADDGVTGFISGMALGVDLWAAQIVLDLRKDNPRLKLCCALPCEGQEKKWPSHAQEQYRSILKQADKIVWVNREYTADCMLKRNRYIVDHSSILLAVYNGAYQSGTGMTVRYAESKHHKIILIDPITREVSASIENYEYVKVFPFEGEDDIGFNSDEAESIRNLLHSYLCFLSR